LLLAGPVCDTHVSRGVVIGPESKGTYVSDFGRDDFSAPVKTLFDVFLAVLPNLGSTHTLRAIAGSFFVLGIRHERSPLYTPALLQSRVQEWRWAALEEVAWRGQRHRSQQAMRRNRPSPFPSHRLLLQPARSNARQASRWSARLALRQGDRTAFPLPG